MAETTTNTNKTVVPEPPTPVMIDGNELLAIYNKMLQAAYEDWLKVKDKPDTDIYHVNARAIYHGIKLCHDQLMLRIPLAQSSAANVAKQPQQQSATTPPPIKVGRVNVGD